MNNAPDLRGRKILIVEDEYAIASDLSDDLTEWGARVLGPVPTIRDALAVLGNGETVDGAILDINLQGEMVYPVADALIERKIPFVFATGYDRWFLPERFAEVPLCEKPVDHATVLRLLIR